MDKKILVAGAGHGGVVCAAILAKNGFKVEVYEKKLLGEIGYDWTDVFDLKCFETAEIPFPDMKKCGETHAMTYTNPNNTVFLNTPASDSETKKVMDRKYLIKYLINYARGCGVRFHFGEEVIAPIADKSRVIGFAVRKKDKISAVFGDLIIDSASMNSPLRSLLPERFGIINTFEKDQVFTTYRAFFKKNREEENPEHDYLVYFFHMRRPGISWVVTEKNHIDILIGRFGEELTENDIEQALADLREKHPIISETMLRGGSVTKIPIRRTIPILTADGYAAIGDCAAMTVPLKGSGITNSIEAGKYLADAVLADENGEYTAATLWKYQYNYFENVGSKLVMIDKFRQLATSLTADDVDYLLEKEILLPE